MRLLGGLPRRRPAAGPAAIASQSNRPDSSASPTKIPVRRSRSAEPVAQPAKASAAAETALAIAHGVSTQASVADRLVQSKLAVTTKIDEMRREKEAQEVRPTVISLFDFEHKVTQCHKLTMSLHKTQFVELSSSALP